MKEIQLKRGSFLLHNKGIVIGWQ